ncbi:MAG: SDR family oxidoreductase [Anaerolineae bacterium]
MKVLFIGGTGVISSACVALAVERGIEVVLLNRGQTTRPVPAAARVVQGDIRDKAAVSRLLTDMTFDVVVNWIAYTPEHVETDLELFRDRTDQYIFISSASAYQTPPASFPMTESTPLRNPYWRYSRDKIACEERLVAAYRQEGFPVTIVRPSHTYDATKWPVQGGYTVVHRMKAGQQVVVHGDGTSLWTLTHHRDFARGFVGLLGNPHALGEAVHITSDEVLTWNQIYAMVARAVGATADLVHMSSETIAAFDPEYGAGLLGDKAHSMVFDNTKIKRLVPDYVASIPFSQGVREIAAWYDSHLAAQIVDERVNQLMDRLIAAAGQLSARV